MLHQEPRAGQDPYVKDTPSLIASDKSKALQSMAPTVSGSARSNAFCSKSAAAVSVMRS